MLVIWYNWSHNQIHSISAFFLAAHVTHVCECVLRTGQTVSTTPQCGHCKTVINKYRFRFAFFSRFHSFIFLCFVTGTCYTIMREVNESNEAYFLYCDEYFYHRIGTSPYKSPQHTFRLSFTLTMNWEWNKRSSITHTYDSLPHSCQ